MQLQYISFINVTSVQKNAALHLFNIILGKIIILSLTSFSESSVVINCLYVQVLCAMCASKNAST